MVILGIARRRGCGNRLVQVRRCRFCRPAAGSTARAWSCARPGMRFVSRLGLVVPVAAAGRHERGRRGLVCSVLGDDSLAGLAAAAVDDRGRISAGWHAPGASLERRRAIRLGWPPRPVAGDKAGCLFLAERRILLGGGMLGAAGREAGLGAAVTPPSGTAGALDRLQAPHAASCWSAASSARSSARAWRLSSSSAASSNGRSRRAS